MRYQTTRGSRSVAHDQYLASLCGDPPQGQRGGGGPSSHLPTGKPSIALILHEIAGSEPTAALDGALDEERLNTPLQIVNEPRRHELASSMFITCHFEPQSLILRVKLPGSDSFRRFVRWPYGEENWRLPSFIAYRAERTIWGFQSHIESENWDRFGPFDELLDAAAEDYSLVSEEDAIHVLSDYLSRVLTHVGGTLDVDFRSQCIYLFIIPNGWQDEQTRAFNQIIETLRMWPSNVAFLREIEAGAFYFTLKYPNRRGVLLVTTNEGIKPLELYFC